jgi:glycosyltransferase involved in cell wall biosynthesis
MRVCHIATRDVVGGAAIAAYRLHAGLNQIGVASQMLVDWKASADHSVHALRRNWSRLAGLRARPVNWRIKRDFNRYRRTALPTLELLTDDRNARGGDVVAALPSAEVYNLHWVSGLIDYRQFFSSLRAGQPLVWTLHDMNPFTGGCHYAFECERHQLGCGSCPQLGSNDGSDLTAQIHARKTMAFSRVSPDRMRVVAPSRWLAAQARQSKLFRRFDVAHVPYGIETDVFRPHDKSLAREVLDLPSGHRILLFVAQDLKNHRKGFDLLAKALQEARCDKPILLVSAGTAGSIEICGGRHRSLGDVNSPRLMSLVYSASDLLVCPTRADNLPNVVLEAMSCGTPVVGFDVGGVPDMIRPGLTGLLAPAEDVRALREAIETLLNDDALRARLSEACRKVAVEEYALSIQARRYQAIYDDLIEASRRLGGDACGRET